MDEQAKNKRGGKRAGSGRKAFLKNADQWKAYLDQATHDFFTSLGDGNFSAGIRKGREILEGDKITITHKEKRNGRKS